MKLRAAIYARVSSAAQRDAHTIESQLPVLRAFAAAQGWEVIGEYIDDGRSAKTGRLEARDGFARLVRDAQAGRFDILVVFDIDRLTRTDDMVERAQILGPFQRANIRIVTPSTGEIDLRTMFGQLDATLRALYAAEENRKRAERIKAGKARAIAEGRKPAGPTPFGLAYSRATGTWSIDEAAAAIVREIFRRVAGGESCVAIAADLDARGVRGPRRRTGWDGATVYRIVRNRVAMGEWSADKARGAVIRVPAILTEIEWSDAQRALIAHGKRGLRRTKHFYLLEGLARCTCGASIAIRSKSSYVAGGERRYNPAAYVCYARKYKGACSAPVVRCAEIDERVWSALCDELVQPDLLAALAEAGAARAADARDWAKDRDAAIAHLARLDRHEAAIMARFRRGAIGESALDVELAATGRERKMVRDQLAAAERAIGATASARDRLDAASDLLGRLRAALPQARPEQRRALLGELARDGGVVIADGRVRLDLRLLRSEAAASREGSAPIALADGSGYRTEHGAILRIRRVA